MNNQWTISTSKSQTLSNANWLDDHIKAWLKGNVFCVLRPVKYLVSRSGQSLTTTISRVNHLKLEGEIIQKVTWHSRNFIRKMDNCWGRGIVVVTHTSVLEELQDIYNLQKRERQININKERLIEAELWNYIHESELRIMNLHSLILCSSRPLQDFLCSAVSLYDPSCQAVLYWLNKKEINGIQTLIGKVALIEL